MNVRHLSSLSLCAALAASLSTLTAQNEPTTRQQPAQRAGVQQPGSTSSEADRILASWLLIDNRNEIELARLAQQRAQSPEVKQFAEQMVKDHTDFGTKLQPFGDASVTNGSGSVGSTDTGRGGVTDKDKNDKTGGVDPTGGREQTGTAEAGARRSATGMNDFNHLALVRELGQQCLQSAQKELQGKSGAEFDRCYMGMQIMQHSQVLDKLQVFSRHASSPLQQTLQAGEQTVKSHLEKAKSIAKQMQQDSGNGAGK